MNGNGGLIGQVNIPNTTVASGMWSTSRYSNQNTGLFTNNLLWPGVVKDANFASVTLVTHFLYRSDGFIQDNSSKNNKIVYCVPLLSTTGVVSTTGGKFQGSCWLTTAASSGGLTIPSGGAANAFNFGTGDFTYELWFQTSLATTQMALLDFRTADSVQNNSVVLLNTNGKLGFLSTAAAFDINGGTVASLNTWHHMQVTRISGVTYMGMDGVQEGADFSDSTNYAGNQVSFGTIAGSTTRSLVGKIDSVRVTKGVALYARTYTVPTAPFPDY